MGFKFLKFSSAGFEKKLNEDAAEVIKVGDGLLCILCDGVGGDHGGDLAAKIAIKSVSHFFLSNDSSDSLSRVKSSIEEANSFILGHSSTSSKLKNMATTLEVLFLINNLAFWGHIGDSRIYHLKSGKLKQITKDHSLVQKLLDEGFLTHKQAEKHPNKNIIIKALGDSQFIEPDVSKIKLNEFEDNRFFMCTDGVSNLLTDREIENILINTNADAAEEKLIELIKLRGASDDYSFIYIEKVR